MIETECVGEHVGQDASDKQQAESFTKWVECVAKKVENGELGNGGEWGWASVKHYTKLGCGACVALPKGSQSVVTDCYCPKYLESGCAKLAGDRSQKHKACKAEGGYVSSDTSVV